ncbi:3-oxoacyl-ACP synthase [bacterium (Candidatus Blackallbacteria) CG17_big_fil_post_rev_8_21_14_2_50_48_46]|uniref:3-oxoacyl-ACP synthase n=1 Tax=bacterium (Candidatus Blackallbacteria) CG17_big_fil_post_rev_8_21_14_2_50_48_46 TaxID=2014261 RepID=A0A2M7GAL1_9BACT|nr:MAG: 3-oxoacyl-ACP synthase [bacterium (Candidatus Blackallbacteria) CG18_big_fil_WC_8_21_14_2_50_49_26]PIW19191.1 MAG: 3-oxoacyl-ACP synthase [bacterium (Candidatus Blackallbacteria) CG17_big_fil_post_rev_8_21_14_2_50_48_46]PIW45459.1 MAG: 3-oxoacyl-ACP synthase [bacterium (Candidatus Blackallbacteria) CG13_big_fil_rev_8_21_14_2_50_49_14]
MPKRMLKLALKTEAKISLPKWKSTDILSNKGTHRKSMKKIQIAGMGKYLPPLRVSSAELEIKMGLEPGWILEKSGVEFRHYVEEDSNSSMGAKALEKALTNAEMEYEELDLIISAAGSYDYPIPDTSCLIQKAAGKGLSGIPSFTVDATCLSFLTALDLAACLIEIGRYRNIAIVSSEIASKSLNPQEWESSTLLGDGAAAAILRPTPEEETSAVLSAAMETYGDGAFYTWVKGGGNVFHPRIEAEDREAYTFHMNGPAVLGMAFRKLRPFVKKLFQKLDFSLQEIELFVPHQASGVALEKAQSFFRLEDHQFMSNIRDHGNCIGASIPMALCDAISQGRVKRGDRVCLLGTGAGLSLGGLVMTY